MTTRDEKKVIANALEVYILFLDGYTREAMEHRRPFPESKYEQDTAKRLSTDEKVCARKGTKE